MLEFLLLVKWYGIGVGSIVLYAFLAWRMRVVLLPARNHVAKAVHKLQCREGITDRQHAKLDMLLDTAANGWCSWLLVILVPTATVQAVLRRVRLMSLVEPLFDDPAREREMTNLCMIWFLCVWLSSPAAAIIVLGELLIFVGVAASSEAATTSAKQLSVLASRFMTGGGDRATFRAAH